MTCRQVALLRGRRVEPEHPPRGHAVAAALLDILRRTPPEYPALDPRIGATGDVLDRLRREDLTVSPEQTAAEVPLAGLMRVSGARVVRAEGRGSAPSGPGRRAGRGTGPESGSCEPGAGPRAGTAPTAGGVNKPSPRRRARPGAVRLPSCEAQGPYWRGRRGRANGPTCGAGARLGHAWPNFYYKTLLRKSQPQEGLDLSASIGKGFEPTPGDLPAGGQSPHKE